MHRIAHSHPAQGWRIRHPSSRAAFLLLALSLGALVPAGAALAQARSVSPEQALLGRVTLAVGNTTAAPAEETGASGTARPVDGARALLGASGVVVQRQDGDAQVEDGVVIDPRHPDGATALLGASASAVVSGAEARRASWSTSNALRRRSGSTGRRH
jgi:hypothetical protein